MRGGGGGTCDEVVHDDAVHVGACDVQGVQAL